MVGVVVGCGVVVEVVGTGVVGITVVCVVAVVGFCAAVVRGTCGNWGRNALSGYRSSLQYTSR